MNMITKSAIKTQTYDPQVKIFKVLTHPVRLAILDILHDGEHCVCHMVAHLGFRQVYISQQLAALRDAGIIQDRRDGWNIYYHVTDERIYEVLAAIHRMTGQSSIEFKKSGIACKCPRCSSHTLSYIE